MEKGKIEELVEILHKENCSCVIYSNGEITLCHERGVKDLFRLLTCEPRVLSGGIVADKVVGKGAAALMIAGGVREMYAEVISEPALKLFQGSSLRVSYGQCVAHIINRAGTGICPVEKLCLDCETAHECMPLIERFIKGSSA